MSSLVSHLEIETALSDAVQRTFGIQCGLNLQIQKAAPSEKVAIAVEVCAKVLLISPEFRATLYLCLSERTLLRCLENMFGEKIDKLTPELADAVREILNIVLGTSKSTLSQKGISMNMAIPELVTDNLPFTSRDLVLTFAWEKEIVSLVLQTESVEQRAA